jgi:hypothetical protein
VRLRSLLPYFCLLTDLTPSSDSFARSLGGAVGLAVANTLLQNIFIKNLPANLPTSLRDQLQSEFVLPATLSQELKDAVLDAYMKGMRDVFIFYLPVVALCLLSCFFIEVRFLSPSFLRPERRA